MIWRWLREWWEVQKARALATHLNRRIAALKPGQSMILAEMFRQLSEDMVKGLPNPVIEERLVAIDVRLRQFETGRVSP